jgi:hypothetical protein
MNSNASATTTTTATNNNIGHKDYNGTHKNETKELPEQQLPAQQNSNSKSIIILLVIFSTSLLAMVYIYMMFPELEE